MENNKEDYKEKSKQTFSNQANIYDSTYFGDPWMISPLRQITNLLFKYSKDGDYRIYSKREISKLLVKCGFNSVDFNRVNYNSFVVTAEVNKQ